MTNLMGTEMMPDFGVVDVEPPIPFKIDGEVFYAVGNQPAAVLFDMADMGEAKELNQQIRLLTAFIQGLLLPESFERLKLKMRDPAKPIGFKQLMTMIQWLMEQYGNRPTQPSPSSPQPSVATNPTSTATAPYTV